MPSPAFTSRRVHLILLSCVLAVGAVLRFTALGRGIPFALGVDEPEIVERAVRMMKTGDFHPHFFDYPGLYIYIQFLTACARFLTGSIGGLWAGLNQAPPAEFYLWGRTVTAAFGTATILLVYHAGRRISPMAGLLSATIFAVQSMHVRESHFVLTDVPMTFFVGLTMVLALRAHEQKTTRAFFWAGVSAGLAAATKYNGGVAILLPLFVLACSVGDWRWRLRTVAAIVVGALAAFLTGAPYTVLALPEFLDSFASLSHMYAVGSPPPEPGWIIYLKHLRINVSVPGLAAAVVGIGLAVAALWREPRRSASVAWSLAASFALIYFWMIAGQRLTYGRYLIPLLPSLSVLAGGALASIVEAARAKLGRPALVTSMGVFLVLAVCWVPVANSVMTLRKAVKVSTEEQAYRWILSNVPKDTKVGMETRGVLLNSEQYRVEYFGRLIHHDFVYYQTEGFGYLAAASQAFETALYRTPPEADAAVKYKDLFSRLEPVATFMPDRSHPGSEWRIYRVPRP